MSNNPDLNNTYKLLDSGNFRKLEKIGPYKIIRQSPQAVWKPSNPSLWNDADAIFTRYSGGEGSWTINNQDIRSGVVIDVLGRKIKLKLTDFGHLGIFPEQMSNWKTLSSLNLGRKIEILNLFAYTGIFSVLLSSIGNVTHLDASRTTVSWANENASLNGITNIRWIIDDAVKFLKREQKRGRVYQGIILDPPSYGRGTRGEVWKIEDSIVDLLDLVVSVFDKNDPCFFLLSSHSQGFTPKVLENLVKDSMKKVGISGGKYISEEMLIESLQHDLPSGASSLFIRE